MKYHSLGRIAFLMLVLCGVGCASETGLVGFTPDSKKVVAWRRDTVGFPDYGLYGWRIDRETTGVFVGVASVDHSVEWVRVPEYYPSLSDCLSNVSFSPDGKLLAISHWNGFTIVGLEQAKVLQEIPLEGGRGMTNAGWPSSREIVYAIAGEEDANGPAHVRFVRQIIGESRWREVYRCETRLVSYVDRPRAYRLCSPDGRYAIVPGEKELIVVDIQEKRTHRYGMGGFLPRDVAWSPDQSAVLLFAQESRRFILVELPSGGILQDRSQPSRPGVIDPYGLSPMEWSKDGQYVVDIRGGGCLLLAPRNWRVVTISEAAERALRFKPIELRPLPAEGWVLARGPDYKDWCAVRYDGQRLVKLVSGQEAAVSPDGRLAATVDGWGTVSITPVQLPPPVTTRPASFEPETLLSK